MSAIQLLNPYCTLRDAQREAGNTDPDSAGDLIEEINKASRWLDEHCRRDFLFHDHSNQALVVQESWCAGNVIYLPWPVLSLTEVKVGDTLLASTEYRHIRRPNSATTRIERNGLWLPEDPVGNLVYGAAPQMAPLIQLKGTFGFQPDSQEPTKKPSPQIPATISQACAAIAAIRSGQVRREIVGPGGTRESVTVRSIPKAVLDSLVPYRIPVV